MSFFSWFIRYPISLSYRCFSIDIPSIVNRYANESQTSISLQTLMRTGRGMLLHKTYGFSTENDSTSAATDKVLIQVAGFLRHELPIRLAHRIQDLDRVPFMHTMPSVQRVRDLYITSLEELLTVDEYIHTIDQENEFASLIERIYQRHAGVLVEMARGAYELRNVIRLGHIIVESNPGSLIRDSTTSIEWESMHDTHEFLDRFYMSRIGMRVLIGQYLSLRQTPIDNYIGLICMGISPWDVVKQAINDASFVCTRKYGDSPDVIISGQLDLTFPYIPTHLHYIMLELLKNSMRAVIDYHGSDPEHGKYPPIHVVIADGSEYEDLSIKVSDEGGGISRSDICRIWSYLFTTADPSIQEGIFLRLEEDIMVDHAIDSPLAGLGYGLPISRSYARYFGGDLKVMSMEGYGTDAYLHLTRLGDTKEPLV